MYNVKLVFINCLIIIAFLIGTGISCDDSHNNSDIITYLIKNNTTDSVLIELYPKEKYLYADGYYKYIDFWEGGIFETSYEVDTLDCYLPIIVTNQLDVSPLKLINTVFDSISIFVKHDSVIELRFSMEAVYNYSWNIFTHEYRWEYKEVFSPSENGFTESAKDSIAKQYVFSINSSDITTEGL